eukprot:7838617-Pyramimonas_sp.AAC.1
MEATSGRDVTSTKNSFEALADNDSSDDEALPDRTQPYETAHLSEHNCDPLAHRYNIPTSNT